jgi:hypothetical protein
MNDHYRKIILKSLNDNRINSSNITLASNVSLNTAIAAEGFRLAQYEIFFRIQEKFWLPFCESSLYEEMRKKKEVLI